MRFATQSTLSLRCPKPSPTHNPLSQTRTDRGDESLRHDRGNTLYLANHIAPKWGKAYLQDVRTVDVELWLHTLKFAPGTRSKIRNITSAVSNHAIRHE